MLGSCSAFPPQVLQRHADLLLPGVVDADIFPHARGVVGIMPEGVPEDTKIHLAQFANTSKRRLRSTLDRADLGLLSKNAGTSVLALDEERQSDLSSSSGKSDEAGRKNAATSQQAGTTSALAHEVLVRTGVVETG